VIINCDDDSVSNVGQKESLCMLDSTSQSGHHTSTEAGLLCFDDVSTGRVEESYE
jgi:hypothetical protein